MLIADFVVKISRQSVQDWSCIKILVPYICLWDTSMGAGLTLGTKPLNNLFLKDLPRQYLEWRDGVSS